MNEAAAQRPAGRALRFAEPAYYRLLLEAMDVHHLHPYDMWAEAERTAEGWTITLRFGEGHLHERRDTFGVEEGAADGRLVAFFREAAADCKKALMADMYKWMKQ